MESVSPIIPFTTTDFMRGNFPVHTTIIWLKNTYMTAEEIINVLVPQYRLEFQINFDVNIERVRPRRAFTSAGSTNEELRSSMRNLIPPKEFLPPLARPLPRDYFYHFNDFVKIMQKFEEKTNFAIYIYEKLATEWDFDDFIRYIHININAENASSRFLKDAGPATLLIRIGDRSTNSRLILSFTPAEGTEKRAETHHYVINFSVLDRESYELAGFINAYIEANELTKIVDVRGEVKEIASMSWYKKRDRFGRSIGKNIEAILEDDSINSKMCSLDSTRSQTHKTPQTHNAPQKKTPMDSVVDMI